MWHSLADLDIFTKEFLQSKFIFVQDIDPLIQLKINSDFICRYYCKGLLLASSAGIIARVYCRNLFGHFRSFKHKYCFKNIFPEVFCKKGVQENTYARAWGLQLY